MKEPDYSIHIPDNSNSVIYNLIKALVYNQSPKINSFLSQSSSGPEVTKLFSWSTQLSLKFRMLIITEIAEIKLNFRFRSQCHVIYPAHKC